MRAVRGTRPVGSLLTDDRMSADSAKEERAIGGRPARSRSGGVLAGGVVVLACLALAAMFMLVSEQSSLGALGGGAVAQPAELLQPLPGAAPAVGAAVVEAARPDRELISASQKAARPAVSLEGELDGAPIKRRALRPAAC